MAIKQTGRKVYTTMQGKAIDMDLLRQRNELTPAVGNARVNARGDELGAGGKIVRPKEEVMKEYYDSQKGVAEERAVKKNSQSEDVDLTEAEQEMLAELDDEWIEDENGDFVKK